MNFSIKEESITLQDIQQILDTNSNIILDKNVQENIESCRSYLEQKLNNNTNPIYGINTGFGSLCNTIIDQENLELLQEKLVMSHACGTGDLVSPEIVKLMLLLKIKNMALAHSGVRLELVERLVEMFNQDIIPVVYEQGSLGASGDLSPLAHMSLPLLGMGEIWKNGTIKDVEGLEDFKSIKLQSKEGIALLNGTQFMNAHGVYILLKLRKLMNVTSKITALSIEAYDARKEPFNKNIHEVRGHFGQIEIARQINSILGESGVFNGTKKHVQDPYSFRCVPQVHGACLDTFLECEKIVERELNAVTDNPTIFPEEDLILSGGNFHGQVLAMMFDKLAIAIAEIASISERRIFKLMNGDRGLPEFLVAKPGLNSGFMICQYTAASIVSQNKQLATPASIDTIDSSNGQEDHVSMGANAATKCLKVFHNLERVISIELMCAAQAFELKRIENSSDEIHEFVSSFRGHVDFVEEDKVMFREMKKALSFVKNY